VIDVYDRMVLDYHVGLSCTAEDAAATIRGAYERRAAELGEAKVVIRSDNGPQFLSRRFQAACGEYGLQNEFIPVRTPNKNAHIEAFHSILERECFCHHEFGSFTEAYVTVVGFMDYYNHRRLHGSLRDIPPVIVAYLRGLASEEQKADSFACRSAHSGAVQAAIGEADFTFLHHLKSRTQVGYCPCDRPLSPE